MWKLYIVGCIVSMNWVEYLMNLRENRAEYNFLPRKIFFSEVPVMHGNHICFWMMEVTFVVFIFLPSTNGQNGRFQKIECNIIVWVVNAWPPTSKKTREVPIKVDWTYSFEGRTLPVLDMLSTHRVRDNKESKLNFIVDVWILERELLFF